jgi:hypothetical protein
MNLYEIFRAIVHCDYKYLRRQTFKPINSPISEPLHFVQLIKLERRLNTYERIPMKIKDSCFCVISTAI